MAACHAPATGMSFMNWMAEEIRDCRHGEVIRYRAHQCRNAFGNRLPLRV
jgi:hypothetical protein